MPHVPFEPGLPGILGPLKFRPETAGPLSDLAEVLLRGPNSLTRGERELIASYVSSGNACRFCATAHSAIAAAHLPQGAKLVEQVLANPDAAAISPKLKALLRIADKVRVDGRSVTDTDVAAARTEGATDIEIHDTVLIAAAFCMYNRYVDGLATVLPEDPRFYTDSAVRIANGG